MKDLGYGKGYSYAFESEDHSHRQEYLPDSLRGTRFYEPSASGTRNASGSGWHGGRSAAEGGGPSERRGTRAERTSDGKG
jgi:replication-associated recombination protein RarA